MGDGAKQVIAGPTIAGSWHRTGWRFAGVPSTAGAAKTLMCNCIPKHRPRAWPRHGWHTYSAANTFFSWQGANGNTQAEVAGGGRRKRRPPALSNTLHTEGKLLVPKYCAHNRGEGVI